MRKNKVPLAALVLGVVVVAAVYQSLAVPATPTHTRTIVLPANCQAPTCEIGFNVTIPRLEILRVNYTAQFPAFAELDWHEDGGSWSFLSKTNPGLTGTLGGGFCNEGVARLWMSGGGPQASPNNITITISAMPASSATC